MTIAYDRTTQEALLNMLLEVTTTEDILTMLLDSMDSLHSVDALLTVAEELDIDTYVSIDDFLGEEF